MREAGTVTEEDIYSPTSNISFMNRLRSLAVNEVRLMGHHGKHRAEDLLMFEKNMAIHVRKSKKVYEEFQEALRVLDDKYGDGVPPFERFNPGRLTKAEALERYDAINDAGDRVGLFGIERKGGEPVPEIHMYEEDPFKWVKILVEERIRNLKNAVILMVGDTGSGKSYGAIDLARYLDPSFTLKGVSLSAEEFFDRIGDDSGNVTGRVTVGDDPSQWANSREYGGDINILLAKIFDIFRSRGEIIILPTPKETKIDKSIRENIHIYLMAPDKLSQGLFEPGDPTFDDKGKIVKLNFYRFDACEAFGSEGSDWGGAQLVLDSVRFPFAGMHKMSEEEVRDGIRELQQEAYDTAKPQPSEQEIRSKLKPGRDIRGTPWPNDPFLRDYELKKRKVFGEAIKEGKKLMEEVRAERELKRKQREYREKKLDRDMKKLQEGDGEVADVLDLHYAGKSEREIAELMGIANGKVHRIIAENCSQHEHGKS